MSDPVTVSPGRIVVGVDGSESSKRALRWGAHLAALHGAELDAVGVAEPIAPVGYGWNFVGVPWDRRDEIKQVVSATVDAALGENAARRVHVTAMEGDPAGLLIHTSRDARMLVLGSHGRGRMAGLLLGSVSAKCVEHAGCPVLVTHETEPPNAGVPSESPP